MPPLASLSVVRPRAETWIALSGTGALLSLVTLGVNLLAGGRLPRELAGTTPLFVVLFLGFVLLTWWLVQKLRFRVTVERDGDDLVLRVEDHGDPLEVRNPTMRTGHVRIPVGRGKQMIELRAGFFVDGRCPLWLESGWGTAVPLPPGWDTALDVVPHERRLRCLWGTDLPDLVEALRQDHTGGPVSA